MWQNDAGAQKIVFYIEVSIYTINVKMQSPGVLTATDPNWFNKQSSHFIKWAVALAAIRAPLQTH